MTALLPASRRAEKFAALVAGSISGTSGRASTDQQFESLLEVVGSIRSAGETGPLPRSDYVADLRSRLMAEADTALLVTDQRLVLPQRNARQGRRQSRLAAATVGLVLAGTGAGVAVAAQSSLPGESLYPIKRGIENMHAAVSFSDAGRGRDLLNQAGTRLDEVEALLARGDDTRVSQNLSSFTQSAGAGSDLLFAQYQGNGDDASVATVRDFAGTQMGQLTDLAKGAPASLQPDFANAAQLLADLDQQARVLCSSCGAREPLNLPADLEPASAEGALGTLLDAPSPEQGTNGTASASGATTTLPLGGTAGEPSATETSGMVIPPLSEILGGSTTTSTPGTPGSTTASASGLGELLNLPTSTVKTPKLPNVDGATNKVTKKVKGALDGVTGSVLNP